MSFTFAIASGKGGTGKTTISVNLANHIYKFKTKEVILVDCDVEEPNDLLFFPEHSLIESENLFVSIPQFDLSKCTFCKKCSEFCEFNAINIISNAHYIQVNTDLCHSCGACSFACKYDAIEEVPNLIGQYNYYKTGIGNGLIEGRLKVGSAMQTSVIRKIKARINNENDIILLDAPPGNSCPVVETVGEADYVILVTEPTPFGLNDLKITIELLEEMNKPFGVIINKAGLGNDELETFLQSKSIAILGSILFDKAYAAKYAVGNLLNIVDSTLENTYSEILNSIEKSVKEHDRNYNFKW